MYAAPNSSVGDLPHRTAVLPTEANLTLALELGQDLLDQLRTRCGELKSQVTKSELPHLFHDGVAYQFALCGSGQGRIDLPLELAISGPETLLDSPFTEPVFISSAGFRTAGHAT